MNTEEEDERIAVQVNLDASFVYALFTRRPNLDNHMALHPHGHVQKGQGSWGDVTVAVCCLPEFRPRACCLLPPSLTTLLRPPHVLTSFSEDNFVL